MFDGSYHDVDSNEMAFKGCFHGDQATGPKGGGELLEPIRL